MPDAITVSCSGGVCVDCTPLTPDQLAAQQAATAQAVQQQQADDADRQQLLDAVSASTDPALLALAKLVGVIS